METQETQETQVPPEKETLMGIFTLEVAVIVVLLVGAMGHLILRAAV